MKTYEFVRSCALLCASVALNAYEIRFDQPARQNGLETKWDARDTIWQNYSLPVGNGALGITSYGGVAQEVLHFTNDSLWSGIYQPEADNPNAYQALPGIRKLLLEDKYEEAEALSRQHLGSVGGGKHLFGSSRPGSLLANLQGVWNNSTAAPWNGDYHLDINLQINYWLTGAANLLECQEPLIDYLELLQKVGSRTAQAYYGSDGWTAMVVSNVWGYTSPNFTLVELTTDGQVGIK